ncbi:hypothetical protein DMB90_16375 [Raoultella planticola]|uniref:Uncharacterized protein n=1 Tax=Raoultella planticola TaxID=575 RepID=A0A5P6AA78_RAOPL|nr:hypothetical protein DMB90_16375 [Raoultella planticola]
MVIILLLLLRLKLFDGLSIATKIDKRTRLNFIRDNPLIVEYFLIMDADCAAVQCLFLACDFP